GRVIINKRDAEEYFPYDTQRTILKQPLVATETEGTYDVLVNVNGGGLTGQAGAIRHDVARALLEADPEYRATLKAEGFLTRDPGMEDLNQAGLCVARCAAQFSIR